ncbi:ribonuclease VapC [Nocardiopsis terrae]|uniref:Ribonuclease VapC n=1 Tax=Nocardiopsis terrae TaxID=372655 RepID=A0ABR9HJZ8_9ACTN|nr:PIN domain nuclease [Nocardiopsis terrae]MBE1459329.1 putative nucleic acid-binding protein [Nocardiopsis terrae]GHC89321.1 ribonuclease VapC [Nocardiopsis terrae]
MSPAVYLVDTSALTRIYTNPEGNEEWDHALVQGTIAVCPVTELEFLYSARSAGHRERMVNLLNRMLLPVDLGEPHFARAWEVQRLLAARGEHRSAGPVDLLVAACAEMHGLVLLHNDNDFETVARVTGQKTRRA